MANLASDGSPQPFAVFTPELEPRSELREAIAAACRTPETEALPPLLAQARLPLDMAKAAHDLALRLAETLRARNASPGRAGLVQSLLQVFALSSQEGVALMCLAEALLRIPDIATRDAMIRDKIANGEWHAHLGKSESLFVNAAAWGLLLTGKLVATHSEATLSAALGRLIRMGGEPVIRKGVDMAMRMMGEQFVAGETIAEALAKARELEAQGFRYSYDMLGEAAMTAEDAERYLRAYEQAIHAIGNAAAGRGIYAGPGISIKLSALHPRYSRAQYARVMDELYPTLCELAVLAKHYDIGLNIDAEEADRLELSLDLLERLVFEPELDGWQGIGFVIQAYQKRCPFVVDYVIDLARRSRHRLMIRLVKGAYWDSEIKRAQIDGLDGYPVYTRKPYTDVSYIACARKLLAASSMVYPQFATHNAHTLAAVYHLADPGKYVAGQYEFQCLHGMGERLYEEVVGEAGAGKLARPCRIYAPVGTHETLLAYLVRRLLENGANTSFVNRVADRSIELSTLVQDPVQAVEEIAAHGGAIGTPHPAIPLPRSLYGAARTNSRGLDLASDSALHELQAALRASTQVQWTVAPMLGSDAERSAAANRGEPVRNPADHRDVVGYVREATPGEVDDALRRAANFAPTWAATPPIARAALLETAADQLESEMPRLMGLIVRESGKTWPNAVSEVREAVDFLRFYAGQAKRELDASHSPLGPVACISPWNFPLAIFTGQIAAALAAGNPVLAKPAEQTPLIAAEAVRVLRRAGVPAGALQLLPGRGGTVGAALVGDSRIVGVIFTGSTEVARILQKVVADRVDATGAAITLIAETGGQNAMIVDSSALTEQVVADAVTSAFDSAGQRCSALRVLCVQEEVADRVAKMLRGAMVELRLGNPAELATDVGPVIDAAALANIQHHIDGMRKKGRNVFQHASIGLEHRRGTFVPATLIELESLAELRREIFGPVLHIVRYKREELDSLIEQINATGYGLTMGLHTRIDETIERVVARAHVGNLYVNRNMIGAVVGVQPFGGEGLSGTGPKAGGPLYLYRLLSRRPDEVIARVIAGDDGRDATSHEVPPALSALQHWAAANNRADLAALSSRFGTEARTEASRVLRGPTGERDVYTLLPRDAVLCLADDERDRLVQLAAVLAVGGRAVWPAEYESLRERLPAEVQDSVVLAHDWTAPTVAFDAVLHHGSRDGLIAVCETVAERPGPILCIIGLAPGETAVPLERLVVERALSVNTAAAGGNASLMTIG
jgi:RHH-type proline utilization regulon transcriptional repressor/proline dehydrogenase/delta 1-pyrroline-5-carboxylate dehydrogenase